MSFDVALLPLVQWTIGHNSMKPNFSILYFARKIEIRRQEIYLLSTVLSKDYVL